MMNRALAQYEAEQKRLPDDGKAPIKSESGAASAAVGAAADGSDAPAAAGGEGRVVMGKAEIAIADCKRTPPEYIQKLRDKARPFVFRFFGSFRVRSRAGECAHPAVDPLVAVAARRAHAAAAAHQPKLRRVRRLAYGAMADWRARIAEAVSPNAVSLSRCAHDDSGRTRGGTAVWSC